MSENIQALQQEDAGGLIDIGLNLIDDWVESFGLSWVSLIWKYVRASLTGSTADHASAVQQVTSLDSLIEFVLSFVDKAVEESGRPLLKIFWKMIRSQFVPATMAKDLQG